MKIKDKISKPSQALQAMIDGLRTQSQRYDFKIRMGTFGHSDGAICFGCAATCAVQEIAQTNLSVSAMHYFVDRAAALNFELSGFAEFEGSIDTARYGDMGRLFEYFDLDYSKGQNYNIDLVLRDDDWEKVLPNYEALVARLEKDGF